MNHINISSDTDLAAKCIGECEAAYVECVGNCTDTDCLLDCGRDIAFCENCMCHEAYFICPITCNI